MTNEKCQMTNGKFPLLPSGERRRLLFARFVLELIPAARSLTLSSKQKAVWKYSSSPRLLQILLAPSPAGLQTIAEKTGVALKSLEVVHGTTVGTNALLERRGARTALVTTRGFEDVLVIGRQARPELYNLDAVKPPPLVPDNLRFGLSGRVTASGEIIEELDETALSALACPAQESEGRVSRYLPAVFIRQP